MTAYSGSTYTDLLVNEIGSFPGWVYAAPGNFFKIESSGSWTVEVRPISYARQWNGQSAITGKGDSVVLLSGGSLGTTTITNSSRSNFSVVACGPDGAYLDLLVNEIGSYRGEVLLPSEDAIVLVVNDVGGSWAMSAVRYPAPGTAPGAPSARGMGRAPSVVKSTPP